MADTIINKAVYLNNGLDSNIEICFCHKYEQSIFKHSGYNFKTMIEMFDNNLVEKHNEYTAKDLEFCIATIELVYDISFLKLLQLIVDGDVELNPGPSNTPTGKQKGRKTKKTTFNFARKKLDMDGVKNNENIAASSRTRESSDIDLIIDKALHELPNNEMSPSISNIDTCQSTTGSDASNDESSIQISHNKTAVVSSPVGLINHANDCLFKLEQKNQCTSLDRGQF